MPGGLAETPISITRGEGAARENPLEAAPAGKGSEMSGEVQQDALRIRLTGRGAVMVMLAAFALGLLVASWMGWPVLAGASFVIGSVAAALYVRPGDLLMVTIAPPLLFSIALVAVKAATATGSLALSVAEGMAITMAEVAPWLFAGVALTLVIAWVRGLRGCVRELRQDLRAAGRPDVGRLAADRLPADRPPADRHAAGRPAAGRPATDRRPDATVGRPPSPAAADAPPPDT
jgi:Domain of unknown function (DUF6542)